VGWGKVACWSTKAAISLKSGNFGQTTGGVGKSGMLEYKSGNISEKHKIAEKLLWRAYRNSAMLF